MEESVKFTKCLAEKAGTGKCSRRIGNAKFCMRHQCQYQRGIIDYNGKKLREINQFPIKFNKCLAENAGTGECSRWKHRRFCKKHYGQYERGIIDHNGKKLRDVRLQLSHIRVNECIAKNAGTGKCSGKKHGRFCGKHYSQYERGIIDHNGKKLRELKPIGGRGRSKIYYECIAKNAGTGKCSERKEGRFCSKHVGQYWYGIIDENGKKLRESKKPENPIKCAVPECNEMGFWWNGYCRKHFLDIITLGHIDKYPHLTNPPEDIQMEEVELKWWQEN
jgi:hypothetical protein